MRFFEPSEKTLDWLARYAGKRVTFDVGCGEGHIVRALRARGVKTVGIDMLWEHSRENVDLVSAILPMAAQTCRLLQKTQNSLVLFCRPCHGGWVEETIVTLPRTAEVLYISLPENVPLDLPIYRTRPLKKLRGREETVYRVQRHWAS